MCILHTCKEGYSADCHHRHFPAHCLRRKFIKGYLSHQHKVAVLSKQEPFPPLSSVALTDP